MKKMLYVLIILSLLTVVLSACNLDNSNGNPIGTGIVKTLTTQTQGEKSIVDLVKDTCPKNADGTCKLMGQ